MGFARQSYIIVKGEDADIVASRVTELLNNGYDLHGDLKVESVVPHDHSSHVVYAQAVIKRGERSYG